MTLSLFIQNLLALIIIINPLAAIPIFLSLSENYSKHREKIYVRLIAFKSFFLLLFFGLLGIFVLDFFHLSLNEIRIAGGFMLCISAWSILRKRNDSEKRKLIANAMNKTDITFTPMAMPVIVGPGTIATIIEMNKAFSKIDSFYFLWLILIVFIACCIVFITLKATKFIKRILGKAGLEMMNMLMGFFTFCIGLALIFSGLTGIIEKIVHSF